MNGLKIKSILENAYPLHLAEEWDNVGLQIGSLRKNITSVLISLDVTEDVINEAIKYDSNLIIVHHPLIFGKISTIKTETLVGKLIELLIKNDITLYVAHTNFDFAEKGTNSLLVEMVPGEIQALEKLDFDQSEPSVGRIVTLSKHYSVNEYAKLIKKAFQLETLKFIGDADKPIKKVAIVGGSGSSFINLALSRNVDLLITGDVTYHHALTAKSLGLNIFDVGHNVEKYSLNLIQELLLNEEIGIEARISKINTNPYEEK